MWSVAEYRAATLYRRATDGESRPGDPAVEEALRRCGSGQPLPPEILRQMERHLGIPLDRVRVHTDSVAARAALAVRAEAFTVGEDIFFAEHAYAPGTRSGDKLLAHELAHVAQHVRGQAEPPPSEPRVSAPGDPLEREADALTEQLDQQRGLLDEAGAGQPVPYLEEMERVFGRSLSHVRAYTGVAADLGPLGAAALTTGNRVAFADAAPSLSLVAHEITHVIQNQNAGAAPAAATDRIAPRDSPAEREADEIASQVTASGVGAALPAITAAPAAQIHLAPADNLGPDADDDQIATIELVDGDRFLAQIYQKNDAKVRRSQLAIEIDYAGSDDGDNHLATFAISAMWGKRPKAALKPDRPGAWRTLEIDLYGDGSHVTRIAHSTQILEGWSPKSRAHLFSVTGPFSYRRNDRITVKSKEAIPASTGEPRGEALPAEAPANVTDAGHSSLPSDTAAIAAKRLLDDLIQQAPSSGLGRLQKRIHADHAKHAGTKAHDPDAAVRLSRLVDAIHAVRPMMKALELASRKEAYLTDIAADAIRMVTDVKQRYGAALEEAYDAGTTKHRAEAEQAFNALWYRLASLYLGAGRGVQALLFTAGNSVNDVRTARERAGRGAVYWPTLESQLGVQGATEPGDPTRVTEASAKARQIRADFLAGKAEALSGVTEVVEDAQVVMGLTGLLVANETFYAFKKDMDGVVGGAFDWLGRDLSKTCATYNARFEAILQETEKGLRAGGDFKKLSQAAVSKFQAIVTSAAFQSDLDALRSRIKWIQGLEILGKVLVVVGVAALTGGVAGAAVSGALKGAGVAGVAAAGGFAAEVVTFTIVSRLGNQALLGGNDQSFTEDLITNTLMFGFLKAATAGYGRVFRVFADPKLHKTAHAIGGGATGMLALQAFAEAHFRIREGTWMEGGDRARSVVQNAAMLLALSLSGYLARPLNTRIQNDALAFTAKHFPGRLEKIGAKIAEVRASLAGLRQGDPTSAQRAPEALKKIEQIWNEELSVLAEAARKERTPQAQSAFKETVNSYVRELAKIDLQLSQAGIEVELGAGRSANLFRPISPGFVAFKPEGKEVLEAFHKEHKGTFEKLRDELYAGKVNGEETFYVPETAAKKMLLDTPDVAGLKDAESTRPRAAKDSNPAAFEKESKAHAEKLGKQVGGPLGATVKEVEALSLGAEMQIEVGLRVLDPLFGKRSSEAFKEAARAINAEPDAAVKARDAKAFDALDNARLRLQKQMLDVLRDPNLEINARRSRLNRLLADFEAKVKHNRRVRVDAVDFAEARKQIGELTADTFKNMLAVDAQGNLTQKGMKVGTLSGLMEKLKAVNNLFRKHGVPRELALSVSAPKDPSIPREVKVLSRTPKQDVPATRKPATPVDPTDQTAEGAVVDIGVGLGDYARDAGGETGDLVKTEYGPSYTDPAMIRRDLTWEHTAPRLDVDSVLVLGDALQTLPMMFGARSVKRMFINNINAHYDAGGASYLNLARGLGKIMASGGRVEVQWTTEPETTGGKTSSRGHITGAELQGALKSTGVELTRDVKITRDAQPVTDFDYSVEAPRGKSGAPSKTPPSNPVPQFRWIFTFGG